MFKIFVRISYLRFYIDRVNTYKKILWYYCEPRNLQLSKRGCVWFCNKFTSCNNNCKCSCSNLVSVRADLSMSRISRLVWTYWNIAFVKGSLSLTSSNLQTFKPSNLRLHIFSYLLQTTTERNRFSNWAFLEGLFTRYLKHKNMSNKNGMCSVFKRNV